MNAASSSSASYRLVLSQGLNAFGDHLAKIVASSLVAATFAEAQAAVWVGIISFLYIAPYVVLAPVTARLTRRFPKTWIVRACMLTQSVSMAGLALSAWLHSFEGVIVLLVVVAAQSSLLAPARNSLMKEYAGIGKIGQMMGLLGLAGVGATLLGLAFGGWSFDRFWEAYGTPWTATALVAGFACLSALGAYFVVHGLPCGGKEETEGNGSFTHVVKELVSRPVLRWSSLGLAWFYGVGAMLMMILLQDGRWDHEREAGAASQGGGMAALLGLGVALGSGLAALGCRKRIEVGLSFIGAIGLAIATPIVSWVWGNEWLSSFGVVVLGIFGGMFAAPLNALLVASARDNDRSATIAANNLVINLVTGIFILIASLLGYLGWSPQTQLLIVAGTGLVVVAWMSWIVPESLVSILLHSIVRVLHPTRVRGIENLPTEGGALLVSNHVSYLDAILIYSVSNRPVRFLGTNEMLRAPFMRWMYRKFNVIPVSSKRAREAISKSVDALKAGDLVCIFPEGVLTRTGMMMPFKRGAELIARLAEVPVVPVYLDGVWSSSLSLADWSMRRRTGISWRPAIGISFGEPISVGEASIHAMRDRIMKLGYEAFSGREELDVSLGYSALISLKKRPLATRLIDQSLGGTRFRNISVLVAGLLCSRIIKNKVNTRRVGLLLPPGLLGFAMNLGALWAGHSATNLNPTVNPDSFRSMIRKAGLDTVITSRKLLAKFDCLPLEETRVLFVEDLVAALKGPRSVFLALLSLAVPARFFARMMKITDRGGDREASLLYSSGSSAEPKGIALSNRNLKANVAQLSEICMMRTDDVILSNLPLFHSFGLNGGFWFPLLKGMRIVATASPLQTKANVEAIRRESVTVMLGTPTFLRSYLQRAEERDLESLRLTIAGAEKLPESFAESWEERFGSPILEGYGLTECAPVIAANSMQSRKLFWSYSVDQSGNHMGTVGRILPGVWIQIVDRNDSTKVLGPGEEGLIVLKGPNVFRGYLDVSLNHDRFLEDGWFNTGDIGRLDKNGCLRIEGRVSRFAKIAGEMVSHQSVELAIEKVYPRSDKTTGQRFFVVSKPCPRKGEALVLIANQSVDMSELARRLRSQGTPNLWMPDSVVVVGELPCLGSGKIDLRRCVDLCAA